MMGSASFASPLCTWLVAACMSVTCAKENRTAPHAFHSSQPSNRLSRWARRRKTLHAQYNSDSSNSIAAGGGGGGGGGYSTEFLSNSLVSTLCGSSFQGLMSSCLAFEPCSQYYSSNGLFRSRNLNRKQRRLNRLALSGEAMAIAVQPEKEVATKKKPATKQRRVVVTGMGVVSPLGHEPDVFYNNLLEGVSGISQIEAFECAQFPTRIAGEIKSFSTDGWIAPKLSKRMDKFMLYMLTAGKKALADGGITEDIMDELDKAKCGVLIGSAMGGMKVFNDAIEALRVSYRKMNPFCVPFATTNMGSAMLAMDLGWMGPNYSISTACATSNFCILNAANHIIRGEADIMLCGGSDAAIIPIGLGGFVACRALSQRNDDPAKASRPWDMNRDGFVMGEGAGVLLLEELEHAKKRGANIYAEFLGGSFTCDAYHMTEPRPGGIGVILCVEKALAQSGVSREDVNYINAHATSTPAGDIKEFGALMHCFGQNPGLRVNSTKSMIGHLLGAAGAVEAIAAIQAIRTGWVHPNINLENPDEGVDTNVLVGPKKERLDVKVALSNSFGFGGHNSSIVFAPHK
ncbi:3-oxoacyl-[acyl-carrier-protein] synthase II, chloroplastic precursor [Jatropha curcas]|uniref:beta-ketoacyl-[acyl-carrier-protein] synthase I n=2 Tax=Jatropha curcas TaxID=180498 RepID=Q000L2_JATCU|nr:3-oxoacyl-[acyl-carrier-protein] synthase II, chloroplastic precursor [Jatropha curcas]ABJ90469.2 beta-ketoacyl-ACP synthase II [Jatropha curcas]